MEAVAGVGRIRKAPFTVNLTLGIGPIALIFLAPEEWHEHAAPGLYSGTRQR
jgi:hypothetical protein